MVRNALIESKRAELERLCREHHVRRLDLFGSAAREDFDPASSDLDFVVEFNEDVHRGGFAGDFFSLLAKLEAMYGRRIDLVEPGGIRNPIFRREVESTRQPIYEA